MHICAMKYIYTFLFILISITVTQAQTGKVTDSVTKQPVDYATISLFKAGAASPFNGSVTDVKGNFTIDNIANGEYSIRVDFLGYKAKTITNISINNTNRSVILNSIILSSVNNQLQTVTIVGKAPVVENKIDKMVYNAQNDLTSQGGVALDVLKKVPMVTVDIDGNVELQGSPSIRFLINGKPSSIFGASLSDALQSIPASQIKNIEVITIPGAKYDAAGTGGIINIVLKDNKVQGFNGSINASAGTRLNNGSVNLNARSGNFGVSAFFSGNQQLNTTGKSSTQRTAYNNTRDTLTQLLQEGSNNFKRSGFETGINLNWSVTKHDEITAAISYDQSNNLNNGLTNQNQGRYVANNPISQLVNVRNSNSSSHNHAVDMSLEYKKTFKKEGQELSIQYNSSFGHNSIDAFQQQDYLSGSIFSTGLKSNNAGKESEINISADYVHPVTEDITIETGVKNVIETINSNTITDTLLHNGNYINNPNQTYGFDYHRKIYAGYLSVSGEVLDHFLQVKTGLRYERTITTVDFAGANVPGYNIFAPSLVFMHNISKKQSIKLSYSYRIERPDYGDLNPFYNISDPHNINTGNPNLKPEKGHNYELGYSKNFEKGGNVYVAAVYRYNTDDNQTYTTFYPVININGTNYSDVTLNQRANIGSQTQVGINVFGSVPITNSFNLRSNIQAGSRSNSNPGNPTVTAFAYRINLNATYEFGHDLTGEVFGNYQSKQQNLQGTRPAFGFYNIAVRKQFLNKMASIGLTAANPFSQYVTQTGTSFGANFNQVNVRQVPYRSFGISLSYKFGKLAFKKEKDDNNNGPQQTLPEN
jgi:ferric enterobactin receptor